MFTLPLPRKIFSVDPATTLSGWSLLSLDSLAPLSVTVCTRGQIDGQKLVRKYKDELKVYPKQLCVLEALYEEYCSLLAEFKPDVVVSESAFGYAHMSALISLTLAINALMRAAKDTLGVSVVLLPPTVSKRSFADHGSADKEKMRIAYNTIPWLNRGENPLLISEHEIDAIAHGVGHIRRDIIGDVIQVSALEKKRAKRQKEKEKEK